MVVGLGGYEVAFAINTLSFFAVFAVVASFQPPATRAPRRHVDHTRRSARVRASCARDPALRFVVGCLSLNSLLAAPFIALIPAVALKVFDDEKFGTAALVTAQGIGAVTMGLTLGALHARFGHRHVLVAFLVGLPVALLAYALAPTLTLAVVTIFFVGFLYLGALSSFTTIAQLRAPAALRGRAVSVLMMLIGALYPIGGIAQGAIADEIGLRATTAGAAVLLGVSLALWRLLRPTASAALDEVGAEDTLIASEQGPGSGA